MKHDASTKTPQHLALIFTEDRNGETRRPFQCRSYCDRDVTKTKQPETGEYPKATRQSDCPGGAAPPGSCVSMAGAGAGEASLAGPRSLREGPSGVGEPPSGPAVCRQGLAEHAPGRRGWFEDEGGRRRPVPFGSRSGLASSSYFFGFFLSAFAPPSRPGLVTGWRTLSSRRRRSVWSLALARGECGCGFHPTLLSLVACIRQLYSSTRRRVTSATRGVVAS